MQKQIKDLKAAAESSGKLRKAEKEEEGDDHLGSTPTTKTSTLVTSDDSDDDVQCLMIAKNMSKEAKIKEALRMMITKPAKVDLEKKDAKMVELEKNEEKMVILPQFLILVNESI